MRVTERRCRREEGRNNMSDRDWERVSEKNRERDARDRKK